MRDANTTACDPADPNRCQHLTSRGQCVYLSREGGEYCDDHSHLGGAALHKERVRHYLLSNPILAKSLDRQASIEEVRSLRDEIHLARMMVEQRLDLIDPEDKGDMLAAFSNVNTYLQTIEKLVSSCHRMEISLGSLLSKSSVFTLGQAIVNILAEELNGVEGYEGIVDRISERVVVAIADQQNEKK